MKQISPRYPLSKAFSIILLSTVAVCGCFLLVSWYYNHVRQMRMQNDAYFIDIIVQTCPEKEALKTVYLEELLGLSVDQPTNLYRFNAQQAERTLLAHPLIKEATVKKVPPGTVYIDYTVRKPIAFLGDFTNTALDQEGVLFPFQPFFTPKNFPEIFIGFPPSLSTAGKKIWGHALKGKRVQLSLEILQYLQACCPSSSSLKKIDVSRIDAASDGQRQIIVLLEDRQEREKGGHSVLYIYQRLLRLPVENYQESLKQYAVLREYLLKKDAEKEIDGTQSIVKAPLMIIDLRLPQLAYIKTGDKNG